MSTADIRTLLGRIGATARPAGSSAEADARDVCAAWLRDAGFEVEERPFTYSALPGIWGTPIAGFLLLVTALATGAGIARGRDSGDRAIGWAVATLALLATVGWWAGRFGTRLLPFMRREGVNLEARRGVPAVWLVAHLDSKSQPVSLLARAWAVIAVSCCWVGLVIAWALSRLVTVPQGLLVVLAGCGAVASVPLLLSWVGTKGHGALDNASGVASILGAARLVDLAVPLGVVVTSAEEFGLAGARAWVEGMPRGVAINCDGADDQGALTIIAGRIGRELWDLPGATGGFGADVRIRRSLPGVLLDSTAFSDRGWAACTISMGTPGSLARVHTADDTLEELSGAGVETISGAIASLAGAIIAGGSSLDYLRGGLGSTWNNKD